MTKLSTRRPIFAKTDAKTFFVTVVIQLDHETIGARRRDRENRETYGKLKCLIANLFHRTHINQ